MEVLLVKKRLLLIGLIVATLLVSMVGCSSRVEFENFDQVSEEYELIAEFALETYNEISPEEEFIIIDIRYEDLVYDDMVLNVSEEKRDAVTLIEDKFDFLRVYEDAVFFCRDETGYYGLVYSDHPVFALYKDGKPQAGREYHRINNRWYEWGVWGI